MQNGFSEILFAYSEEIRLRIAILIQNSEVCVNCLVDVLKLPQSTISRHIGIMRRANIVKAERKGANTYYSANINNTEIGKLNKDLLKTYSSHIKNQEPFLTDMKNLLKQKDVCTVDCKVA
ncbi:MAG: metalloregulator ArsR/SmtB family transcription factor [Spirochaetia bacterium]|nr:metalloregulator ArsR/SmtB family transcription factor [Spirochaetia bacterium]